jgi:hypothetical protein
MTCNEKWLVEKGGFSTSVDFKKDSFLFSLMVS